MKGMMLDETRLTCSLWLLPHWTAAVWRRSPAANLQQVHTIHSKKSSMRPFLTRTQQPIVATRLIKMLRNRITKISSNASKELKHVWLKFLKTGWLENQESQPPPVKILPHNQIAIHENSLFGNTALPRRVSKNFPIKQKSDASHYASRKHNKVMWWSVWLTVMPELC